MSSKNEIIGALTVERDKANEARDKAIKERDEAREQIRRLQKRDRLEKELDALDEEIEKHALSEPLTFAYDLLRAERSYPQYYLTCPQPA